MEGNEIGEGQDFIEAFDQFNLKAAGAAGREIRIVSEDTHSKGHGATGKLSADAAHAENGEGFAIKLNAFKALAIPFACFHRGMGLGNIAGKGHHQRESMFCRGDRIATRGVHHNDASLGSFFHIDIIHAHSSAANHF